MREAESLLLSGAPGSPYTREMVALLRYRRIPYRLMLARPESRPGLPQPRVRLLPTFYLPGPNGELEAVDEVLAGSGCEPLFASL